MAQEINSLIPKLNAILTDIYFNFKHRLTSTKFFSLAFYRLTHVIWLNNSPSAHIYKFSVWLLLFFRSKNIPFNVL